MDEQPIVWEKWGVVRRADDDQLHSFSTSAFFTLQPLYPWAKNPGSHCGQTDGHSQYPLHSSYALEHITLFIALCNRSTRCSLSSIVWIQPDAVNMTRSSSTAIIPISTKLIPCIVKVMNTSNCHQNEQQLLSLCLNRKEPTAVQLCPHIKYAIHWDGVYYRALSVDICISVVKKREGRRLIGNASGMELQTFTNFSIGRFRGWSH
jgi:hypothetical protein